ADSPDSPISNSAPKSERLEMWVIESVGKGLHFVATLAVATGTLFSAFWIIAANSWMQTPVGHAINNSGQFVPADWWQIIFSPSFPYRLIHTVLGAYLTTALVVGAVGAWHLLRDTTNAGARVMFSMAMGMVVVVAPIQAAMGDFHGLNTLKHQPTKIMAIEGHFESYSDGAPLYLFGLPDQDVARVRYPLAVPKLGSLILHHSFSAPIEGLKTVTREEWPPVAIVFWSFRLMVGLGLLMVALGGFALFARMRGGLYEWRNFQRCAVAMGPAGFVAVIAGWVTTEVGRQPYTVYGLLRTGESVSPLDAPAVASSLVAFIVTYFAVFSVGAWYILRLMSHAPAMAEPGLEGGDAPIRTAGTTPASAIDPDRAIGAKGM
ncbi:cytochrome ubiquinol oxidase subunit I, partial [Bradyrhizobium sp. UFLA05-153]